MSRQLLLVLALAACGTVDHETPDAPVVDAPPDVPPGPPTCDPRGAFGAPQLVGGLAATGVPADASLSPDELTIYLTMTGPAGDRDIYTATRTSLDAPFANVRPLASVRSDAEDSCPSISDDGLTLVFHSHRVAGEGSHLYVATRSTTIAEFGAAAPIAGVASPVVTADDIEPHLSADGSELWFISSRTGSRDIYRSPRAAGGFASPIAVAELTTTEGELHPVLSADRLTAYFASNHVVPGVQGGFDIFRARRTTIADGFGAPELVTELETAGDDNPRWLSRDQCRLYLHTNVSGGFQIYVATRAPTSAP